MTDASLVNDSDITASSGVDLNEDLLKLAEFFPQFVKDGEVDFDAFKAWFSQHTQLASVDEKYSLGWAGKSEAVQAIRRKATGTLKPEKDESKNWDTTKNLFIEGDNLEVLKLLMRQYADAIKMIYIDPPYNKGKDFVYKDNFHEGVSDYYLRTGQDKEGANYSTNSNKSGRYHSNWLNMMYPRLFYAKQMLTEDGVIFVSIDDSEVNNLRLIMDELFGAENFVTTFIWKNKAGGGNDSKHIAIEHEYIVCYARSKDVLNKLFHSYDVEYAKRYKEEDEEGRFFWDTFARKSGKQFYPITCPDGTVLDKDEHGNPISWLRSKARFESDLKKGDVKIIKIEGRWSVQFKQRIPAGKKPRSILSNYGTTSSGSEAVFALFQKDVFSNPKPPQLIKHLIDVITDDGDIIMDFFSGSGTTAEAVFGLNADYAQNRQWICVQLPEDLDQNLRTATEGEKIIIKNAIEVLDSLGRPHLLTELAKERIARAGDKILADSNEPFDHGFKVFKLVPSNYHRWRSVDSTSENLQQLVLEQAQQAIKTPLIDNYSELDVVYEVLLKEGANLNASVQESIHQDHTIYTVTDADRKIVVTFADKVNPSFADTLGMGQDDVLVCLDNSLSDTDKANLLQAVKLKTI